MFSEDRNWPEHAGKVPGLTAKRLADGLFCPTGATGVPKAPKLPQKLFPTMLLQDISESIYTSLSLQHPHTQSIAKLANQVDSVQKVAFAARAMPPTICWSLITPLFQISFGNALVLDSHYGQRLILVPSHVVMSVEHVCVEPECASPSIRMQDKELETQWSGLMDGSGSTFWESLLMDKADVDLGGGGLNHKHMTSRWLNFKIKDCVYMQCNLKREITRSIRCCNQFGLTFQQDVSARFVHIFMLFEQLP